MGFAHAWKPANTKVFMSIPNTFTFPYVEREEQVTHKPPEELQDIHKVGLFNQMLGHSERNNCQILSFELCIFSNSNLQTLANYLTSQLCRMEEVFQLLLSSLEQNPIEIAMRGNQSIQRSSCQSQLYLSLHRKWKNT